MISITCSTDMSGFIAWLCTYIKKSIVNSIDYSQLTRWNEYFKNSYIKWHEEKGKKHILSPYACLYLAASNLIFTKYKDRYIIEINPSVTVPKTNIKIVSLVKLITYGTVDVPGYRLLEDVRKYYVDNIETLYNRYINGGAYVS